jgi:hypothetical protein
MTTTEGPWLQQHSGQVFDFDVMDLGTITIEDIAHALSNICRFGGHSKFHYSVAQHSILVANLLPTHLKLEGLLHDAHEAFVGDIVTDVKQAIAPQELGNICDAIDQSLCEAFEVQLDFNHPEVRRADLVALATEQRDVMMPSFRPWRPLPNPSPVFHCKRNTPNFNKSMFLSMFTALRKLRTC